MTFLKEFIFIWENCVEFMSCHFLFIELFISLQTVRTEGFMALYKGFIPIWVRLGPWNIIVSFETYSLIVI